MNSCLRWTRLSADSLCHQQLFRSWRCTIGWVEAVIESRTMCAVFHEDTCRFGLLLHTRSLYAGRNAGVDGMITGEDTIA